MILAVKNLIYKILNSYLALAQAMTAKRTQAEMVFIFYGIF